MNKLLSRYSSPLKIAGLIVAGVGYFIANELQRRETEEFVEKVIAEREAMAQAANENNSLPQ